MNQEINTSNSALPIGWDIGRYQTEAVEDGIIITLIKRYCIIND